MADDKHTGGNFYNRGVDEPVDKTQDGRGYLPDTTSGLSLLPDGHWTPVFRPLATGNGSNPWRGAEGHGTDDPDGVFYPNEDGDVAPLQDAPGEHGKADFVDIGFDGTPLFVAIVPHPMKAVSKSLVARTVFDGTEQYGSALYVPDVTTAVSVPRDPARTSMRVSVTQNVGTTGARFVFAMSTGSFAGTDYIVLRSGDRMTYESTEPVSFAIIPIAANDGTKNDLRLQVVLESASTIDRNSNR